MEAKNKSMCPWWMGYFLLIPIRKFSHNPVKLLKPHIKENMNVLDFGCAMGYFSLPLAKMVGNGGNVYCADIQEKMLDKLQKRAEKAGVAQIIKPLLVGKTYNSKNLKDQIDFTLLFAMVHEVPDKTTLFHEVYEMMKSGGKVLFAEPQGHVSPKEFDKSIGLAIAAGFTLSEERPMKKGLSAFLIK